jgi:cation diffusion facilitator CzcD-associated flavoprotein CzcO
MTIKHFDVIIIGGGIGGMMAAYKLASHSNKLNIAIL